MKKKLLTFLKVIAGLYIVLCVALYFFQEKLIFFPQQLEKNYQFNFKQNFNELNFIASVGKLLNGLLFKADSTKGLIFYLHGNSGSLMRFLNFQASLRLGSLMGTVNFAVFNETCGNNIQIVEML